MGALSEQNLQMAAGSIGGNPQPKAQTFEYNVLTNSRTRVEDREYCSHQPSIGNMVYLKDIARVELAKFNYGNNPFVLGKRIHAAYLAPGANALETNRGVMKALDELRKAFPKTSSTLFRWKQPPS
jgi:HAE1 family hydrophobic/amphiphilic exporter-1